MKESKAAILAEALGGDLVPALPRSCQPGVLVRLGDGRVAVIDELGGETFSSLSGMDAFLRHGDQRPILASVEWSRWDCSADWALGLGRLLGSRERWHSGDDTWLVLFERADGLFAVIGEGGVDVYQGRRHWVAYGDGDDREPRFLGWG